MIVVLSLSVVSYCQRSLLMTLVALVLIQACWELGSTLLALPGKVLKKINVL